MGVLKRVNTSPALLQRQAERRRALIVSDKNPLEPRAQHRHHDQSAGTRIVQAGLAVETQNGRIRERIASRDFGFRAACLPNGIDTDRHSPPLTTVNMSPGGSRC